MPAASLTAPTGSKKYGLVAPGSFRLVVHGLGFNVHATLGNAYFPSKCSTSISGEPDSDRTMLKSVPKTTFRQRTVVIRYAGATNEQGIAYRWSTTFTLKRIKFKP